MSEFNGTLEQCRDRVRATTRSLSPDQMAAVAAHHYQTGDSVWHSVHVALGTPKCHCVPCERNSAA